ncbi:hypothetical protein LXA43DRAFT_1064988 [Ganoderma leucocontextum]|nr:hypothetical protein LXA43DRAFT_1064988 [Ganoderma leucocontextum]
MSTESVESAGEAQLFSRSGEVKVNLPPASRALNMVDITLLIVEQLLPDDKTRTLHPYRDLSVFGCLCTATYPSAMSFLYRTIQNLPVLWSILVDRKEILEYKHVAQLTRDPIMFTFFLRTVYGQLTTTNMTGEDPDSYKFRRFLFICSRVQELWTSSSSFTPAIHAFFMKRLPCGRECLFPSLKKINWIERDRKNPQISLRSSPIPIPCFAAFRRTGLQQIDFELHDLSPHLDSMLGDEKFVDRMQEFIALFRRRFPDFYSLNITLCRPDWCTNPLTRAVLTAIRNAVLKSGVTVTSPDIDLPSPSLPYCKGEWATFGVKENFTIDVVTPKGRSCPAVRDSDSDEGCLIFSALTLVSSISFAMSYRSNTSLALVPEKNTIVKILRPCFQERALQYIVLHLDSIAMPLFTYELLQVGAHWRQLRYLDLRFKVICEHVEQVPIVETVRTLTHYCPVLEHLYLPELNVVGFRDCTPGVRAYSLRTLTSCALFSDDDEAKQVASALLSAFPNLWNVMTEISAPGWDSISMAIHGQLYDTGTTQRDRGIRLIGALNDPVDFQINLGRRINRYR